MASQLAPAFDPAAWLRSFTEIGGGYALTSARKLCFLISGCNDDDLTSSMAQIVGHPERLEAVRAAIEARQLGDAS